MWVLFQVIHIWSFQDLGGGLEQGFLRDFFGSFGAIIHLYGSGGFSKQCWLQVTTKLKLVTQAPMGD